MDGCDGCHVCLSVAALCGAAAGWAPTAVVLPGQVIAAMVTEIVIVAGEGAFSRWTLAEGAVADQAGHWALSVAITAAGRRGRARR